jgi:hypothetical protein
MATNLKNALYSELGTTPTTVVTTISNGKTTVIGLSLTNLLEIPVLASIQLDDGVTAAYFLKNVVVPPNQSLRVINGGEKLVLGVSTDVIIEASEDISLDLVMSYVEIV